MMTADEFRTYLKAQAKQHGTQGAFARYCGISEAFLSDVLRGRRDPGPTILGKLGFVKQLVYAKKEEKGG